MGAPETTPGLESFVLDILGQQPKINRLYTHLTLCFPLSDDLYSSSEAIVKILTKGLERLSENFPWVAGKVVRYDDGNFMIRPSGRSTHFILKEYKEHHDGDPHDVPDWTTLENAKFPFSMLDELSIAPQKTLAVSSEESISERPILVFLVQANLITGGLLLTFSAQHGSMDMRGQAQVMHLLAKACREEKFTGSELRNGNMNRENIIPLLDESDLGPDRPIPINPVGERDKTKTSPLKSHQQSQNNCTWAYFLFPDTSLAALKSIALTTTPLGGFVSTDDALSAFVWQSITQARLPRIAKADSIHYNSTLSRNVDVRRHFGIPESYPGLVIAATIHTAAIDVLSHESLGTLAAELRSALNARSLKYKTCKLATIISKDRNSEMANFVPKGVPELDVRISSWAKENCSSLDFGFGKPVAVRRPRFREGAREGLVYFLPKSIDGEIAVGICLRDEDMERLKTDHQFSKFGRFIG
ncbi:hypothetical protein UREG_06929 [Paecilomyces variotii No. 5]|uniref:Trichothecene 3-O-acetyltransferase-like N-terminal domain-containing protein n=1 Tax=Byssochlamys spectabilis (strain No. 5 / NBRC 109023) TaxID=1356009 RepID=V5GB25_BYSSN|nr:hypothetical protein UREG_06929 [Paecilomyces variotii No. 5]